MTKNQKTTKLISIIVFMFTILFIFPKVTLAAWGVKTLQPFIDFTDKNNPVVTLRGIIDNSDRNSVAAFRWNYKNAGDMSNDCGSWKKSDYDTNPNIGLDKNSTNFEYILQKSGLLNKRLAFCAEARKGYWKRGEVIWITIDESSYSVTSSDSGNNVTVPPYSTVISYNSGNVVTGNPTNVTSYGVTLSGSANPEGVATSGYFRYSMVSPNTISPVFCNDIYGSNMSSTSEVPLGSGNNGVTFKTTIDGLWPNTTYYYCAIASTKDRISYGSAVKSFTTLMEQTNNVTPANLLSIKTKNPLVVNSSSAYLNGFFNANISSETWFEYRKKINTSTAGEIIGNELSKINSRWIKVNKQSHPGAKNGSLSYLLTGLTSGTEYQFRAVISPATPSINPTNHTISGKITTANLSPTYGIILNFKTKPSNSVTPGEIIFDTNDDTIIPNHPNGIIDPNNTFDTNDDTNHTNPNGIINNNINNNSGSNGNNINNPNTQQTVLYLGQIVTPPMNPVDTVVRQNEGIETVFARQIMADEEFAKLYGYQEGADLQSFAWYLADVLAKAFGYVNSSGKEIRVSTPDIAAYQLQLENGKLIVYEYYNSRIVNIQKMSLSLRSNYYYEYYFKK